MGISTAGRSLMGPTVAAKAEKKERAKPAGGRVRASGIQGIGNDVHVFGHGRLYNRKAAERQAFLPIGRLHGRNARCATTFSIILRPASWPSDMMDSGWNCTAATGSLRCSIAMIVPSSVSAVTMKSRGNVAESAKSEW